jgi:glycosyltransferase involved in cell wall biosynthesis
MRRRIVIAHDYITQRGGGERVALELARILSPEYIVTSLYSQTASFAGFESYDVRVSFLNRFKLFRNDPRIALPFLAWAWKSFPVIDADVIVCSSSGWAHAVRGSKRSCKIVYCHNPARWLYQGEDYLDGKRSLVRLCLGIIKSHLIEFDKRAAATAQCYIVNSNSVGARVREAYGREPVVLFPPVNIDISGPTRKVEGLPDRFFLTVSRGRGYKGSQLLSDSFRHLPQECLVIAGAGKVSDLSPNVKMVGYVSDEQLRWLYKQAVALISVSKEDFGLTPIEANSFGTPALLLRAGGFLDSTVEGVSGAFIDEATVEHVVEAVSKFPTRWNEDDIRANAARFSPEKFARDLKDLIDTEVNKRSLCG